MRLLEYALISENATPNEPLTLVTGAGGFVGSSLCRSLASGGDRFVGVLSPRGREPDPGSTPWAERSFRWIDLRDAAAVGELVTQLAPGRIFNLAAVGLQPDARWRAVDYVDVNVRLPAVLWEAMPRSCVLVQAGSMSQYRSSDRPIVEDMAERDLTTLYSWSKNAADSLLESLEGSDEGRAPRVIRARLFGMVGSGEPAHRLLPSVLRGCLRSDHVKLSDGGQVRDVLHVDDAVSALLHVSCDPSLLGQAVNVGRGEGRTVRWMAERAADRLSCREKLRFGSIPRRAREAQSLVADVARLRTTGWRPRWSIEESIDRALDQMAALRASA